jgi:glycosyltransferase involved in cell wall biosynthesis
MLSGRQRLAALKDCELLALPSCHENFGIVVAEAMAAGVPVLVSDQVGLHDEVTRWEAGAVTSLDVAEISAALEKWLTDPSRRRRAGENGRVMARQHFDWNAIAGRWVAHYHAIISESSGRHS